MATPEELRALANRIDHEELWRWAGMDHDKMTPEQKDRHWAGVHLRRYASDEAPKHRGERWEVVRLRRLERDPVAKVRLAGVLLDEKAYDEALKVLGGEFPAHFSAAVADRKGDILVAQNKIAEARDAYKAALDAIIARIRSRDNDGTHVQLVVREQGRTEPRAEVVGAADLVRAGRQPVVEHAQARAHGRLSAGCG